MNFQPLHPDQLSKIAEVISDSFNTPQDKAELWIQRSGIEHWRIIQDPTGEVLGGLLRIPMAQWFGGRPVSMTGLAGVAMSSFGRGQGAGQGMMRQALQEMRSENTALSALYGSTTSFYRRCGYERAGSRFLAEVQLKHLEGRGGPLQIRRLTGANQHQAEELQRNHVRSQGALQRCPYLWHRVRNPRGQVAEGFGFYREEALEGYCYWVKELQGFRDNSLEATDLVLTSADAATTFLGLLSGQRPFFHSARWPSGPSSPLLLRLSEPWQYTLKLDEHWMLRIVSLVDALTQRGYSEHLKVELHLHIEDPWLEENRGRWILKVEGGKGKVESGGRGDLQIDIGALASLYSGFASSQDLLLAARLAAAPEILERADQIFGGCPPQLLDFF